MSLVASPPIIEMFKFDFIQDSDNEQSQAQTKKAEANEPALTEISLIELVRPLRLRLQKTVTLISFAVGHFALPH
jgi:hypothetical protein